jgi:diguanylate cyclase (GGDEF)-like protein
VERIRALVEESASQALITVSVGVAAHPGGTATAEELLALADRPAYRAKFSGRNAVAVPAAGDPVSEAECVLLDTLDGAA